MRSEAKATALAAAAQRYFFRADELSWRSHDPFDLLLSPYLGWLRWTSPYAARVAVQIGRRNGIRLRRMLRVPEHEEAKTATDYLSASSILARSGEVWAADRIPDLVRRVIANGQATVRGFGWGFNFPYASRFANVARGSPNLYQTTCASQALLDAFSVTVDEESLAFAHKACSFILDELGRFEHGGRCWLRYWPMRNAPIVNVQALAASMLVRAGTFGGDERFSEAGRRAMTTVLATQSEEGSWPYSVDGRATFVDGFHTGFILQALVEYSGAVPEESREVHDAVDRGLDFFNEHLLSPDGLPRAVADGAVSLDSQNLAQCIQTLAVCWDQPADRDNALRLWELADDRARGNARPSLRWTLGPLVLAAAHLVGALRG